MNLFSRLPNVELYNPSEPSRDWRYRGEASLGVPHNSIDLTTDPDKKAIVYAKILERKARGMATLLVSENLDELFLLSNRIIVICDGEIMGELPREKFDKYSIGLMMSGVKQDE